MTDPLEIPQPMMATPPRRGHPLMTALAWLVILASCAHVIWDANRLPTEAEKAAEPLQLSLAAELTAKMCVGLGDWSPEARNMILDQARALDDEGRLGALAKAVVAAELTGLDDARAELDAFRADLPNETHTDRTQAYSEMLDVLERLYSTPEDASATAPAALTADEKSLLELHLGWVGRLAPLVRPLAEGSSERDALLAPLRKMPLVMLAFACWGGLCLLGGLAAMITLLVLSLNGRLRHGFGPACGRGGIYAEVFAVWIAIFVGGKLIAERFQLGGLTVSLALTFGGLIAALGWGLFRGVAWRDMRQDLGLHTGRGFFTEVAAGLLTYCMAIPLLAVALIITLGLAALQRHITPDAPPPGHPVQQFVVGGDWRLILQVMILAAVIAPFVEETVFRGALYRHLRDATGRIGLILSFIVSAGVSSLLFAAIHPQGWPFIPVLASLALTFCFAREWRGSVLPGMVAHGVNNFVIMTLNVFLLAS